MTMNKTKKIGSFMLTAALMSAICLSASAANQSEGVVAKAEANVYNSDYASLETVNADSLNKVEFREAGDVPAMTEVPAGADGAETMLVNEEVTITLRVVDGDSAAPVDAGMELVDLELSSVQKEDSALLKAALVTD